MSKKILILGGARFHGLQLAESLSKKEEVYVLNRGKFKPNYHNINHLIADRNNPFQLRSVLQNKEFDVIVDNNAYFPKQIKSILKVMKGKFNHYIFTSTIATYLLHSSNNKVNESEVSGIQKGIFNPKVKNYALGKLFSEEEVRTNEDMNYTIFRVPNIFGEGDFFGKLSFFYKRLNQGKILLEKEINKFSLIYVKDLVKVFEDSINNKFYFRKTLNVASTETPNYETFFSKIYGDLFSNDKLVFIDAKKMWKAGQFPLFTWGPIMDTTLFHQISSMNFTPLETWGKRSLDWELENKKDILATSKITNLELKLIKENA